MKYFDGQDVKIGDLIDLGGDMKGVVRAIPADDAFDENFSADEWTNLETGILVESEEAGLVHYPKDASALLFLIERRPPRSEN